MKYLKTDDTLCQGARVCETACAQTWFRTEDPEYSCIRLREQGGQRTLNVCNQCGECIEVCPVRAISRNKMGVVVIDRKICVGCFMCVGFCPSLSMRRASGQREPFKCVACGKCAKSCPHVALAIAEKPEAPACQA
jgi:Fe-S-cluster-containing hydrogenase component 2